MTEKDIRRVEEAFRTLNNLNEKYGYPHGENVMGIVFFAVESFIEQAKAEKKTERRKKPCHGRKK